MATTRQGGAGIGVSLQPLIPYNAVSRYNPQKTLTDRLALASGETWLVPPGQWFITPGLYTFIQVKDPISGLWVSTAQTPNQGRYVSSDGANYRVANLTGCLLGAYITNVGSGYTNSTVGSDGRLTNTNPVSVAASAGSSVLEAIVGGAINSTVTITTAGAGYTHKPLVLVEPPPPGGIPATAIVTVTAGAIASVVVVDQGAGYQSVPAITVIPDPRDTVTTEAVLTATLTGSGTITAIKCTDHGTPLTAVPTFTITGGGGASGAATAVMCFTATGFTITNAGVAYGNALPVLISVTGGRVAGTAGAVVNPSTGVGLLNPRNGFATVTSEAGGTIAAVPVIEDGGLFSRVPTAFFVSSNPTVATTNAVATVTVGGVTDVLYIQPA